METLREMVPDEHHPGSMILWVAATLLLAVGLLGMRRRFGQADRPTRFGIGWIVLAALWLGLVGQWWWIDGAGAVATIDEFMRRPKAGGWPWFGVGRTMFLGCLAALVLAGIGVAGLAVISWRTRPWLAAPLGIAAASAAGGAGMLVYAMEEKDLWHMHGHAVHNSCFHSSMDIALLAAAGLGLLALPAAFAPLRAGSRGQSAPA